MTKRCTKSVIILGMDIFQLNFQLLKGQQKQLPKSKIQTKINTKIHIGVSNNNEARCVALGHSNKYKKAINLRL